MRDLTVIIPTYKMGRYMRPLFESIVNSTLGEVLHEVLFVCDVAGDQDDSVAIIQSLIAESKEKNSFNVRLILPAERRGIFMSRYLGGNEATTEKLLFLDSRVTLPLKSAAFLKENYKSFPSLCPAVDIDTEKNVFNLYWSRSHAAIFRGRERALARGPFTITPENFDQFVIGTTAFLCSRSVFLECCQPYLGTQLYSDDTLLMKKMSGKEPIVVHPEFRIHWEPRDRAWDFLKHLYYRGPGLAEYHFFIRRGPLFYAVLAGAVFVSSVVGLLLTEPELGVGLLAAGLLLAFLSTAFLAKGFCEFAQLAPLHVAVMAAYGFGALRGAWIVWKKRSLKTSTLPLR